MKTKRTSKGFTLIELLVVVAIIALLMAILLPGLKMAKNFSKRVVCGTRLRQIGTAVKMYADANDDYLPDDHNIEGKRERHAYAAYRSEADKGFVYPDGRLKPLRLAYLYELDYIEVPEVFYCPGNNPLYAEAYVYDNYVHPDPWGTLDQVFNAETGRNQWVRTGYIYYPISLRPEIDSTYQAPVELAQKHIQINHNLPIASDLIHNLDSVAHVTSKRYSLNFLYSDGHIASCVDQAMFTSLMDPFGNNLWETLGRDSLPNDTDYYDTAYFTVFRAVGPQ